MSTLFYLGFLGSRFFWMEKMTPSLLSWERILIYSQDLPDAYFPFICENFSRKKLFWSICYDIDLATVFRTKRHILEAISSPNMTLVTSHVMPNILFWKGSIHKEAWKGSSPKDIIVFSPSNVKYFKFLWGSDHKIG